jgi:hypothetical protein
MERDGIDVTQAGRISVRHVATAVKKVRQMSLERKVQLTDEIFEQQPNLLASCVVQQKLGASMESVEFLLNILLVCFQAMRESGYTWPTISEQDQERELSRLTGSVQFSEELSDPSSAHTAREQYVSLHREAPLFAFVVNEFQGWLQDLASRGVESESDKFVMMAGVNLVNCIAAAGEQATRT